MSKARRPRPQSLPQRRPPVNRTRPSVPARVGDAGPVDPVVLDGDVLQPLLAAGLSLTSLTQWVTSSLAAAAADDGSLLAAVTGEGTGHASATLISRQAGVIAGLPMAALVFAVASQSRTTVDLQLADGQISAPGQVLLRARGPLSELLAAQLTVVSLVSHLSGIATLTRLWVAEVAPTETVIRGSAATLPSLAQLQRYALRCGGGIGDPPELVTIEAHHIAAAGSVQAACDLVRTAMPEHQVEVVVRTPAECMQALDAGITSLTLEDMDTGPLLDCLALAAPAGVRVTARGGFGLETAAALAATGLDSLAPDALMQSPPAIAMGLEILTVDPDRRDTDISNGDPDRPEPDEGNR